MEYVDETTKSPTIEGLKDIFNNSHLDSVHYWTVPTTYTIRGEVCQKYKNLTIDDYGVSIVLCDYMLDEENDIYAVVWLNTSTGCVSAKNPVTEEMVHQPISLRSIRMIDAYWRTTQEEVEEHYKKPPTTCIDWDSDNLKRR